MTDLPTHYQNVLDFWFGELSEKQWWIKDQTLDLQIRKRFERTHAAACRCELASWLNSSQGRLAEIIVLDQFSRNLWRGQATAFQADPLALGLAQEAIDRGAHLDLTAVQRSFLYMPFMHSESPLIHEMAMALFSEPGIQNNLNSEIKHKQIIDRFGRYPHRNSILGRVSTAEETAFLLEPGSTF